VTGRRVECSSGIVLLTKGQIGSILKYMDIAALSTGLAQQRVQQEAAIQVQKMALDGVKDQGSATVRLLESANVITDPSLGNAIDIFA